MVSVSAWEFPASWVSVWATACTAPACMAPVLVSASVYRAWPALVSMSTSPVLVLVAPLLDTTVPTRLPTLTHTPVHPPTLTHTPAHPPMPSPTRMQARLPTPTHTPVPLPMLSPTRMRTQALLPPW
ncbi:hypothetical protein PF008_g32803 [Phytophthora fragariae]|uniref:Uncharacterized protein n=1 Tax=Phytophthora fragariae TaxID=53985 RepID=A0A6G0PYU4_9STRA|nr:hypothetical protein PF008_g32803 [Phytophthora fragariae]